MHGGAPSLQEHGVAAIGRSLRWFEQELVKRGIGLHPDSGLERSLRALRDLERKAQGRASERLPAADVQRLFLDATGADFLTKALHWGCLSGLTLFDGHWPSLGSSNPIVTSPAADDSVAKERSLAWELVLASLARTFCSQVCNAEPDVVCHWEGKRIGIAAKVLRENTQRAFVRHMKKGIEQIHASDVDGGCVVINLVDLFPHTSEFERLHRARVKYESTLALTTVEWVDDFLNSHHPDWRRLFRGKSKLMTIAMFVPTVLTIWKAWAMPMPIYRLHLFSAAEREDEAMRFTSGLQRAFDDVLGLDYQSLTGNAVRPSPE